MSTTAIGESQSYAALDLACHDIRVFMTVSLILGVVVLAVAIFFAAYVATPLGAIMVLAYFPFSIAFVLSQHLISLRMKKAEFIGASPARRQRIASEVREYQAMMLKSGLIAPVTSIFGTLFAHSSLDKEPAKP